MHLRKELLRKLGSRGTILVLLVLPLFFVLFTQLYPSRGSDSINPPKSASEVILSTEIPGQLEQDFLDYIAGTFSPLGGFPNTGSSLKETYYAFQITELYGDTSMFDPASIQNLIESRLYQGGFRELGEENASIASSFYATQVLHSIGGTLSIDQQNDLKQFVNNTIVNGTIFTLDQASDKTSPETLYQAISILDWLGTDLFPTIDYNETINYLLEEYYVPSDSETDFGLFTTTAENTFETTYYACLLLQRLGKLEETRYYQTVYKSLNNTGYILSGNNQSLTAEDGDAYQIAASDVAGGKGINITLEISLDRFLDIDGKFSLGYCFLLNLSKSVATNGSLLILNTNSDVWENLTNKDALASITGSDYQELFLETGLLNVSNYTSTGGSYEKSCTLQLYFEDPTDFSLDIDLVQYNYTMFNKSFVANQTLDRFSLNNFGGSTIPENGYAAKILDLLGKKSSLSSTDLNLFAIFTKNSMDAWGGWRDQTSDRFSSMKGTYFGYFILNFAGDSLLDSEIIDWIQRWIFRDGGVGSAMQLSLPATFRAAMLLNSSGMIYPDIEVNISLYLTACRPAGQIFFNDENPETSIFGDTYFGVLLGLMVNYTGIESILAGVATNLTAIQTPSGNFADTDDIKDLFFIMSLINMSGDIQEVQYLDALRDLVVGTQMSYGGFLRNPYGTISSMESTSYGTRLAVLLDILEQIQLTTIETKSGVHEYVETHQSILGGFFEENEEFLVNDTYAPTNEITALTCQGLIDAKILGYINATGITEYVYRQLGQISEIITLNNTNRLNFYEIIRDRYYLQTTYLILDANHLRVSLSVDEDQTYPSIKIPLAVQISLPEDEAYLLEGCEVYVTQYGSENDLTLKLEDNQNGLYEVTLIDYAESDNYIIRVSVDHPSPDYFGFVANYTLRINDPIDQNRLQDTSSQFAWFNNIHNLTVPIINMTDNNHTANCNVTLWDARGNYLGSLNEDNGSNTYYCPVNSTPWWFSNPKLTVHIEGDLVRTQDLSFQVYFFPQFFSIFMILILILIIIGIALLVRRQRNLNLAILYLQGEDLSEEKTQISEVRIQKAKDKAVTITNDAISKAQVAIKAADEVIEAGKLKLQDAIDQLQTTEREVAATYQEVLSVEEKAREVEDEISLVLSRESIAEGSVESSKNNLRQVEKSVSEASESLSSVEEELEKAQEIFAKANNQMKAAIEASVLLDPASPKLRKAKAEIEHLALAVESASFQLNLKQTENEEMRKLVFDTNSEIETARLELEKQKQDAEKAIQAGNEARKLLDKTLQEVSVVRDEYLNKQELWEQAKVQRNKVLKELELVEKDRKKAVMALERLEANKTEKMKSWIEKALEKRQAKMRKAAEKSQSQKMLEKERKKSEKEILYMKRAEEYLKKKSHKTADREQKKLDAKNRKERKRSSRSIAIMQKILSLRKRAKEKQRLKEKRAAFQEAQKKESLENESEMKKAAEELQKVIISKKQQHKEKFIYLLTAEEQKRLEVAKAEEKKRKALAEQERKRRLEIEKIYQEQREKVEARAKQQLEKVKEEGMKETKKLTGITEGGKKE